MVYRAVDADGDMRPSVTKADMLIGPEAVLAAVNSRIRLLFGEWWEDRSIGFKIPHFLYENSRQTDGAQMLANYITYYISATAGVSSVADVDFEIDNRVLKYRCTIITEDGQSIEGSVNSDAILQAIL